MNIIDTVRDKIYCLQNELNFTHKFCKAAIIPSDIPVKGANKDRIQYQIVYVTEIDQEEKSRAAKKKEIASRILAD